MKPDSRNLCTQEGGAWDGRVGAFGADKTVGPACFLECFSTGPLIGEFLLELKKGQFLISHNPSSMIGVKLLI